MNIKQKTCLLVGIAAIVVMGLFPPWVIEKYYLVGIKKITFGLESGPYSWIGSPPTAEDVDRYKGYPVQSTARFIDLYRLGVQFFLVAVVTAGLIVIFKDTNILPPLTSLIFSVALVFLVFTIFYDWFSYHEDWAIGLSFFAGIWILYLIIRLIIALKNRNRSRNGRKKESNNL